MKVRQNVWAPVDTADGYGKREATRDAWENFEDATSPEYMVANGALLVKLGSVVVDVPGPLPE